MISKDELNTLRNMSREIIADAKELRRLENAERKREVRHGSILRSMKKAQPLDGIEERIEALREKLSLKQQEYLAAQADLERKIAEIPDHVIRVVLSMAFVDLLTYEEAAADLGRRVTGGALQVLVSRFLTGGGTRDDSV